MTNRYFAEFAPACLANGYGIIAVKPGLKAPFDEHDWQHHGWELPTSDWVKEVAAKHPDAGIGIAGGRITVAVDLDTPSVRHNKRYQDMAREICGDTPLRRVGQAPKIALIYRAAEPIISCRLPKIDMLGLCTHIMAYGDHPFTGEPYRWIGEGAPHDTPVADLPAIDNVQAETLMTEIAKDSLGDTFKCFRMENDRNALPIVLSSRTILAKQLFWRFFRGKRVAREKAHIMLRTSTPTGSWGLVLQPETDNPINWFGDFPVDP